MKVITQEMFNANGPVSRSTAMEPFSQRRANDGVAIDDFPDLAEEIKLVKTTQNLIGESQMIIGPVVREPGLPYSVSLGGTATVEVTIDPPLAEGQNASFRIDVNSANSGSATIVGNPRLTASGTIEIRGEQQTEVGNGNGLTITGLVNNIPVAVSPPFTVCAHPHGVCYEYFGEVDDDPNRIGVFLRVTVVSDSGNNSDLNEVTEKELVTPDFGHTGGLVGIAPETPHQDKHFHPAINVPNDRHTVGKVTSHARNQYKLFGGMGGWSNDQLDVFTCRRCGIEEPGVLIRCSGHRLTRTLFTENGKLTVKFHKEPKQVTVTNLPAEAGLSEIIEHDVVVPPLAQPLPPVAR